MSSSMSSSPFVSLKSRMIALASSKTLSSSEIHPFAIANNERTLEVVQSNCKRITETHSFSNAPDLLFILFGSRIGGASESASLSRSLHLCFLSFTFHD